MWRIFQIIVGAMVAATMLLVVTGYAEPPVAETYRYDYPHRLSSDYIYRTGRVVAGVEQAEGFNPVSTLRRERRKMHAPSSAPAAMSGSGLPHVGESDLRLAVKDMARELLQSGGEDDVREQVVAVSTFVNLNQLYRTSSLGRYLSEQLISELHGAGIKVVEVRKSPGLMISQDFGEYILTRDMDELSYVHKVDAVVAGTYTFSDDRIYINARLLSNEDGLVLASAGFESTIGPVIGGMLVDEAMPVRPQRPIAVKTLAE